jgi:HAD superfamily hydrolase (TIGR01490 family)
MKPYIAFFDLDNTLLSGSSGRYLVRYSYKNGLLSHSELVNGIYSSLLYRAGFTDSGEIVGRWIMKYRGWPEKKIRDFCARFFEDVLIHRVRREAREAVEFHRSNGGKTVILSASTTYICEPVRKHLGMDDCICTSLEAHNGVLTGRLAGKYCYGAEKLNRVILYCASSRRSLEDAFYYADAAADLPVLDKVGFPMCVTPARRLKRVARLRGWPVLWWR